MPRERHIIIGRVVQDYFVRVANCGYPGGLLMHWRGRVGVFQPIEFLGWEELAWAIERRLELAGLEQVGERELLTTKETGGLPVRVRVRRKQNQNQKY